MKTWSDLLAVEEHKPYFRQTLAAVEEARRSGINVFPPREQVFAAFEATPLERVRVVIFGQDPYHGAGQAHGLCFSVQPGTPPPPSLLNIFKELARDIPGFTQPAHGCLTRWAEQGVLLLNTVLTVEEGRAHSHAKLGWETFTDMVVETLSRECAGLVFLLWGAHAQKKGARIDRQRHHVLCAPHPSPLSAHRGFIGCGHFSAVNRILEAQGLPPIDWRLDCTY